MNRDIDKGISEIAGIFTDPLIMSPGGWGDTLPGWLKQAIILERLVMTMKSFKGEVMRAGDCEACAYLYTALLEAPPDHDWADIYIYVTNKAIKDHKKGEIPPDLVVESLSNYQMGKLNHLKHWLYERRIKAREDSERADRRQEKEKVTATRAAKRPMLFDF